MKIKLLLVIQAIAAYNLSGYPEIDVIPPVNKTLTNLILGNITLPPSGDDIYDYSNDITNCTDSHDWVFKLTNASLLPMMMGHLLLLWTC